MLTKNQKKEKKEIDELIELIGLNYNDIESHGKDVRLLVLKGIKNQFVRGQIITDYTLIDEFLNSIICRYFFDRKKSFIKLWKTKKFKNFNYFILEKIFLLNKLDLAKNIIKIPREIESGIKRINDLRNGLAHSFFPENLKRNKPLYKGKNIFTLDTMKIYLEDKERIVNFLFKKAYQIDISDI